MVYQKNTAKSHSPKYRSSWVIAFPIPVAPPVTMATLFLNKLGLNTDEILVCMGAAILTGHMTEDYKKHFERLKIIFLRVKSLFAISLPPFEKVKARREGHDFCHTL